MANPGGDPSDPREAKPPPARGPDEDDDEPWWVSTLVSAGSALGMNKLRLRWKLRRWVRRRREDQNRVVQKIVHVRYEHRVCGHCTAVNDRGETTCHRCGRPLQARAVELARRFGLWVPRGTVTTLLTVTMLVVFVAMQLAQSTGVAFELHPWVLLDHGANLPGSSDPLRELTSLLVHGGVFHAVLAMFTAAMVGGLLERELGPPLVIPVFLVTGAIGAAASDVLGRGGLGYGAAAGVAGLIGAGAIIGQRAGTRRGLTYRNELLSVGVIVVGFGLFVNTDYRSIVPAAAAGAVLGWSLPRAAIAARPWLGKLIGFAGAAGLIAVAVLAAGRLVAAPSGATGAMAIDGVPREPSYADKYMTWSRDPGDVDDVATQYVMCEAVARSGARTIDLLGGPALALEACMRLAELRRTCADIASGMAAAQPPPADAAEAQRQRSVELDCQAVRQIDAMLLRQR